MSIHPDHLRQLDYQTRDWLALRTILDTQESVMSDDAKAIVAAVLCLADRLDALCDLVAIHGTSEVAHAMNGSDE